MFSSKDIRLLANSYFHILRETEDYYEIQSKNSLHCWIVRKVPVKNGYPVALYHKHSTKIAYYHKQANARNVEHAIQLIKHHDDYVLLTQ